MAYTLVPSDPSACHTAKNKLMNERPHKTLDALLLRAGFVYEVDDGEHNVVGVPQSAIPRRLLWSPESLK